MRASQLILLFILYSPLAALGLQEYTVRVVDQKPLSREHFVQGLEIAEGMLYLSTGHYGKSHLLRYRFDDLALESGRKLNRSVFAEGLTVLGEHIYQLTWRNKLLFVYDKATLEPVRAMPLAGQGWGLTNNGETLIYTDGGAQLHFMAPESGKILRSVTVRERGKPLSKLNELEWIEGRIWANVWLTDRIVIINPDDGEVTGSIDLSGLLPASERRENTDVLNGIAYDQRNIRDKAVWVTGKRWPWLYRIEIIDTPTASTPMSENTQAPSISR